MPHAVRGVAPVELSRCDAAPTFLQSGFWGSFKARFGWNARAFSVDWSCGDQTPLLVIRRKLFLGASFAYVPWGPVLPACFPEDDEERNEALKGLAVLLRRHLPHDTAFIRFDPPWATRGVDALPPLIDPPFIRAGADVQPPDTVIVDLNPDEDALLGAMKPKWRYNIRLAEKKGVSVRRADAEGLDSFYALYRETARRDRIAIHGIEYYRGLFAHAADYSRSAPDLRLYLAEHEGAPIASIIVLIHGAEATYLYGASSDEKRSLMPAYALQWRAMRDAKAAGCSSYDFYGIPPADDPGHPMYGLYRFKTGFGGEILHRPGSWDFPYRRPMTALFRAAEGARRRLRSLKKAARRLGRKEASVP